MKPPLAAQAALFVVLAALAGNDILACSADLSMDDLAFVTPVSGYQVNPHERLPLAVAIVSRTLRRDGSLALFEALQLVPDKHVGKALFVAMDCRKDVFAIQSEAYLSSTKGGGFAITEFDPTYGETAAFTPIVESQWALAASAYACGV